MKKYEEYTEYCRNFINDKLSDYIGTEVYACDLGYTLCESINIDGSATYSTHEAKEYIKHWWDEAAEVYQYQKDNYGKCLHNPFEEPEAFHVCMIIEGVNSLLSQCHYIDEHWNDEIKIDKDVAAIIKKQIKSMEVQF